ncbi:peroxiredoxin [Conexibacter sp. CPCC 206217]|uniref:peroxiredoxin n=1 Tax=Conexibacter sp. CPCC 206217 TaxID=3064574 RepID=UPI0027275712|nr:peroxiredoxin [Conexibacter sp. CPCC 206217]MDO8210467.1 peroxiredoxin [Conexibacter sp. CPCC 206217]
MDASNDFRRLPAGLPIPVDDGAADHLLGLELPAVLLPSTHGELVDLAVLAAEAVTLVLYLYPRTGRPDEVLPEGWDDIPGARGCTVQNIAFRDHRARLNVLGAEVVGLSAQTTEDQQEFAAREHMPYPLLSDPQLKLAQALDLPTFEVSGMTLYKRLTMVARAGVIERVFYPIFPPDRDAANVVAWLGVVS